MNRISRTLVMGLLPTLLISCGKEMGRTTAVNEQAISGAPEPASSSAIQSRPSTPQEEAVARKYFAYRYHDFLRDAGTKTAQVKQWLSSKKGAGSASDRPENASTYAVLAQAIEPLLQNPTVSTEFRARVLSVLALSAKPREQWMALEPVWVDYQIGGKLSEPETHVAGKLCERFFDGNSVLQTASDAEVKKESSETSARLATSAKSEEGRNVRIRVNRTISVASASPDSKYRKEVLEALGTAVEADSAFLKGDSARAALLLNQVDRTISPRR